MNLDDDDEFGDDWDDAVIQQCSAIEIEFLNSQMPAPIVPAPVEPSRPTQLPLSLKADAYAREGEIKILRQNLQRAEDELRHLRHQLTEQASTAQAEKQALEMKLKREIDKITTEMNFKEQEFGLIAMSQRPVARQAQSVKMEVVPTFERFCAYNPDLSAIYFPPKPKSVDVAMMTDSGFEAPPAIAPPNVTADVTDEMVDMTCFKVANDISLSGD
ncbi:hypothetical protein HK101_011292 [Irineochytrium annulatum]|nr:hypothetical protein HK101_011292 [Irineochytrium annulatum]